MYCSGFLLRAYSHCYAYQLISMHSPKLVYIESMARVKKLSLSGKILRLFVDRFFVQWQAMADSHNTRKSNLLAKVENRGLLV